MYYFTDGGWSLWADWSECSATCNGGLQSRSRRCDNPEPSVLGAECDGNNIEYAICNSDDCDGDSGMLT